MMLTEHTSFGKRTNGEGTADSQQHQGGGAGISVTPAPGLGSREAIVKECFTKSFFRQKLNYIHFNPSQPHWNLAALPEDYKWSSAAFYEKKRQ